MKNQLYTMTNQRGFMFPYVLFIITILLIFVTSSINFYRNDIQLTQQYLEHIRVETLFQMGREKYKQNITNSESISPSSEVTYEFPDGNVTILTKKIDGDNYHLFFTIYTKELNMKYTYTHTYHISNLSNS
ncbi:hypothetical protein [Oceanobacillus halophilus]|uniref:Competence protein ComG n=1 Tax=Oceanobacillus halophilus TaxID=930130 RepID=A0A495AGN2_9BACI|nr:hypothetical protein [Oceanobacillus halophilus]RKQ37785.1 hypothetical protein D8M06_02995 [Oceanobacillus halophilus]